jgi:LEA14-like dessication related protein
MYINKQQLLNFTVILISTLVVSCGNIRNIEIEELREVKLKTLKGNKAVVEITVLINNPSAYNIYVKDADIEVLRDEYSFGKATLFQKVKINKRSNETVNILFNLEITDRMTILSGRIRAILAGQDRTKLYFSGYIKGGTKMLSKSIRFENIGLE